MQENVSEMKRLNIWNNVTITLHVIWLLMVKKINIQINILKLFFKII